MSEEPLQDPQEWLRELFEFEYCEECSGDAKHHEAILSPVGQWFARCCYPPAGDGTPHPVIQKFRAEQA